MTNSNFIPKQSVEHGTYNVCMKNGIVAVGAYNEGKWTVKIIPYVLSKDDENTIFILKKVKENERIVFKICEFKMSKLDNGKSEKLILVESQVQSTKIKDDLIFQSQYSERLKLTENQRKTYGFPSLKETISQVQKLSGYTSWLESKIAPQPVVTVEPKPRKSGFSLMNALGSAVLKINAAMNGPRLQPSFTY